MNDLGFPGGTELTKQTQPWKRMKLKQTRVYFPTSHMQGRGGELITSWDQRNCRKCACK